jgi:hypothetical protein
MMEANRSTRRTAEAAAMLMIGDGVLGLARPAEHCLIWRGGPRWWRDTIDWFADHPQVTRGAAALELGAGLWLVLRSQRNMPEAPPEAERRSVPA